MHGHDWAFKADLLDVWFQKTSQLGCRSRLGLGLESPNLGVDMDQQSQLSANDFQFGVALIENEVLKRRIN